MTTTTFPLIDSNVESRRRDRQTESRLEGVNQFSAVVRSAGERTTEACGVFVSSQLSANSVVVIQERPFEKALRSGFEAAIDIGKPWTIVVDADVLLTSDAVSTIWEKCRSQAANTFQVQFCTLDRIFNIPRPAGLRVYRTSLLKETVSCIPSSGEVVRPEMATSKAMVARGYGLESDLDVIGLHDYEQFYCDLFRKSFFHAAKHVQWIGPLIKVWRALRDTELDYEVACQGAAAGLIDRDRVVADISFFQSKMDAWSRESGIPEKAPLGLDELPLNFADRIIDSWIVDDTVMDLLGGYSVGGYYRLTCERESFNTGSRYSIWKRRLASQLARLGLFRMIPWSAGLVLSRVGHRIQRLAEHRDRSQS